MIWRPIALSIALFLMILPHTHANQITFAVGHDHEKMLSANYPIYRANWEFINESLNKLGYTVNITVAPWARAKTLVQAGVADGLFLAANLEGREQWAKFSKVLGYGIFGTFYNVESPHANAMIASIRIGSHDTLLAHYKSIEVFEVATAQEGLRLLHLGKVDRMIMSESYGKYLLDTELSDYDESIDFDLSLIERRTVHIAFAKHHKRSLHALDVVNKAITLGFEEGLYIPAMERNNVPERMRYKPEAHAHALPH